MRASRVVSALILCSSALLFLAGICAAQQEDAEGCKDYPFFSRMKSFYIDTCETKFDAFEFYVSEEETKTVEGQKTVISYYIREGQNPPSELQIRRNYANAVKSLGGAVLYDSDTYASFKLTVKGQEIWMSVRTSDYGGSYELAVVEVGDRSEDGRAKNRRVEIVKK
jgi:hypothetical protein